MYTVTQILERLNDMLPDTSWHITGATRTICAAYLPASKAIALVADIDVVAQFWLSSPIKWLKFEIAGGGTESKTIRDQVADDLRRFLVSKGLPEFVVLASGSTICRLNIGSGDQNAVHDSAELDVFIAFLRDHVSAWIPTEVKLEGAQKAAEKK